MLALKAKRTGYGRALAAFLGAGVIGILTADSAQAHYALDTPTNWVAIAPDSYNGGGMPEKTGPCGNEGAPAPAGVPTGVVTAFSSNADGTTTITITLHETTFHPGHYRVALKQGQSSTQTATTLPDPVVTAAGGDPCGMAVTETVPAGTILPDGVIADGVLTHTAAFAGEQTIVVRVPASFTCTRCTLQVIEYMSSHPAPCFYHHCADVTIGVDAGTGTQPDSGTSVDASPSSSSGGGSGSSGGSSSGPGGSSSGSSGGSSSSATTGSSGSSGAQASSSSSGGATSGSSGSSGTAGGSSGSSSGSATGDDGGALLPGSPGSNGCGCVLASGGGTPAALGITGVLAFATIRRRRRRSV
jgi:MYXO-CTERM domain-containing protein